ncbi:methyltransferase [Brevundimonas sp. 2R-24]|uniref:Methyltransferase n=1 Tax=Peiella sedimenti TaxID=3061083 RepID=A0ABT8SLN9_9CAUL|nr:methyltransferase [Caulobacteraceae bacterium XZ-24]
MAEAGFKNPGARGVWTRRGLLAAAGGAALVLTGCGERDSTKAEARRPARADGPPEGSMAWAVAGDWRGGDRARDAARHPAETLEFFDLAAGNEVAEFWPGAGWWTEILAPWLARNQGRLHAANFQLQPGGDPAMARIVERFRERFGGDRRLYGDISMVEFGPTSGPVAPAGSLDLALFMDNIHTWMAAGIAEKAFADAFAALKPGGRLGVVQARADSGEVQDPAATSGYVQEAFVKQLAQEAGFEFVAGSEVNANAEDTKDHPFGIWTLPPHRLSAPPGRPADPTFDHTPFDAIGEADRMTLKFRKPA